MHHEVGLKRNGRYHLQRTHRRILLHSSPGRDDSQLLQGMGLNRNFIAWARISFNLHT